MKKTRGLYNISERRYFHFSPGPFFGNCGYTYRAGCIFDSQTDIVYGQNRVGGGAGAAGEGKCEKEKQTGGQAQFDWILDSGPWKTQPIGALLVCLKKCQQMALKHFFI